jgi:hypothetical protein
MKTKIVIGSLIAVTILLLMPSIPAIQNNIVKENLISESIKDFGLNELKEVFDFPNVKLPILFIIVVTIFNLRAIPAFIHLILAYYSNDHQDRSMKRPLLGLRGYRIMLTALIWAVFWTSISRILGWNWELYLDV